MTKTSTALAIAGGTLVTVCVAGGGVIGLAHAFDQPHAATSTLTTSHGVTTKSADDGPFAQKTTAPAPVTGTPLTAPPPVVVPPAAPRILDVPVSTDTSVVPKKVRVRSDDAHRWMHEGPRGDLDARMSNDPAAMQRTAPAQQNAPAPQLTPAQRMAPTTQQAPGPRHRAEPRGGDWGHHDGGSYGGHHR